MEPHVFHTVTGRRIESVRRVDAPVHVDLGGDPGQHHVSQIMAPGPIRAILQHPGPHSYNVDIYGCKMTTTLHGTVEVSEDSRYPAGMAACATAVMEDRVEP